MKIDHYESNNVYVITPVGTLIGKNALEFNKYLKPIIEEVSSSRRIRGMIFDMSEVSMIDSSGIGAITGKFVRMKKLEKKFALTHVNNSLFYALATVNLDQVVTFYATTAEALYILGTSDHSVPTKPNSGNNVSPARGFMRPPSKN